MSKNKKPLIKSSENKNKSVQQNKSLSSYITWIEFFTILILVFITYGNSIKNDYNLDDAFVVSLDSGNPLTKKGILGIPEILKSKYSEGEGVTYGYRPLGRISMAIEYSFWENNAHYSHLINVLLFALNVFLLLLFIKEIATFFFYKNSYLIYLSILLFIVHPIHTEVVCSIKNREEILCFTFLLSALLTLFKFIKEKKWVYMLPFFVFTFLAFLSKETAFNIFGILLLIVLFVGHIYTNEKNTMLDKIKHFVNKKNIALFIGIFVIAFSSYQLFNQMSNALPLGDIGYHFEQNPYHFLNKGISIPNVLQTVFFYIKKLCLPFPLLFYYGYDMLPVQNWFSVKTIFSLFIFSLIGILILYNFKKRKHMFVTFWILFFLITVFPFLNIFYEIYVTGIVGERLVYQASAGFCVVIAAVLLLLIKIIIKRFQLASNNQNKLFYIVPLLVVLPYFIITVDRNTQWANKTTLFQHDIKYLSNSARANFMMAGNIMNNIGMFSSTNLLQIKNVQLAKQYLEKAITVYPKYDEAWLGIGSIYLAYLSNTDSAIFKFNKVDSTNKLVYSKVLESKGDIHLFEYSDIPKAAEYYTLSLRNNSKNKKIFIKTSEFLFRNKMYNDLIPVANIGIENGWPEGYVYRGNVYYSESDTTNAMNCYQKAFKLGFRNEALLTLMNNYYSIHK